VLGQLVAETVGRCGEVVQELSAQLTSPGLFEQALGAKRDDIPQARHPDRTLVVAAAAVRPPVRRRQARPGPTFGCEA
jgi:hypothetical protein